MKTLRLICKFLDLLISFSLLIIGFYFLIKGDFINACVLLATHSLYQIPTVLSYLIAK